MSLQSVTTFAVPAPVIEQTEDALVERGDKGYECFVLWSGVVADGVFEVRAAHVPEQTAYQLPQGLLVRVDGAALHRLNIWLYENEQTLGAQVHAHPTKAYHSETDDTYPIVTTVGGLSVVAPDFCRAGLLCRGTAAYRLDVKGWVRVRPRRLRRLLAVV